MFLIERWFEAWASLGVPGKPELRLLHSHLVHCYSEPHRHYHTLQHLAECFDRLSELKPHLAHKPEVELALWFRLLDRPHIFSTELFRNRYEARARANLLKSIHRLTKSF